jgi:hypothetical protein
VFAVSAKRYLRVEACLHVRDDAFPRIGNPSFISSNLQEHIYHDNARRTIIAAAAALALTFSMSGCERAGPNGADADEGARNEETARRFAEEVFSTGNYAYIDAVASPDFVEHMPAPQYKPGIEGLKGWIPQIRQAQIVSRLSYQGSRSATADNVLRDCGQADIRIHDGPNKTAGNQGDAG